MKTELICNELANIFESTKEMIMSSTIDNSREKEVMINEWKYINFLL